MLLSLSVPALVSGLLQVSGLLLLVPVFGERILSLRLRLGALVALCMLLYPLRLEGISQGDCADLEHARLYLNSFGLGLYTGLSLRMAVFALQIFATFVAQLSSLSQILGTSAVDDPSPALNALVTYSAFVLLTLADFHLLLFELLHKPGILCHETGDHLRALMAQALTLGAEAFRLALVLSLPFMSVTLVYNGLIGFLNRAMPQLMVAFVGAPLLIGGFLVMLVAFLPMALSIWMGASAHFGWPP